MTFRLKAASGPHTGRTFDLGEDTAIGSAEQADICIEGLPEEQARIVFDGQTLTLESRGEAFVNGVAVARQALKSGDEVRFGEHRFVLQAPGLRPPRVLDRADQRQGINPWTWIVIGAVVLGGLGAVAAFVVR